eukprot:scaffold13380_cov110-Cylindrotheca_fusiformis.AAC.4
MAGSRRSSPRLTLWVHFSLCKQSQAPSHTTANHRAGLAGTNRTTDSPKPHLTPQQTTEQD